MQIVGWPITYAQESRALGIQWPRGILLHGPSGTGKSAAVAALAAELNAIVHLVTSGSIIGSFVGESERKLREAFDEAHRDAAANPHRPVILFLDDVDTLCPKRTAGQQHEARMVGQLLTLLDGAASPSSATFLSPSTNAKNGHSATSQRGGAGVVVIAATSRPNAIDPALRRPGRLDREIAVPIPSLAARTEILRRLILTSSSASSVDVELIARQCHGYTGADLEALCREAMSLVLSDAILNQTGPLLSTNDQTKTQTNSNSSKIEINLTTEDFLKAKTKVGASIARSVVKEFPPARWEDVGGVPDTKRRLRQAVEWPITRSESFKRLGIRPPRGVLLHGPPGCAKTTLARAAATASGATFIPLEGASLYSMYVGEGESMLRDAFKRARMAAPSIIFIDELDMLVGARSSSSSSSDDTSSRLLSTFLNEMDGLDISTTTYVLVLATTNRPARIDPALLRPGRFDAHIYVPPPDTEGRVEILTLHTKSMPLAEDVDLKRVAEGMNGRHTGAEVAAVCREAAMAALREDVEGAREVCMRHFERALAGVPPGLSEQALLQYAQWPCSSNTHTQ